MRFMREFFIIAIFKIKADIRMNKTTLNSQKEKHSMLSLRRATMALPAVLKLYSNFYPRSPCGERLSFGVKPPLRLIISIHALLAESDTQQLCPAGPRTYFYPRSPCGERLQFKVPETPTRVISIHALLAESDQAELMDILWQKISIHALLAESDGTPLILPYDCRISIHALLAESDSLRWSLRPRHHISIHALLAESDSKSAQNSRALLRGRDTFYGIGITILAVIGSFYPFCPCFFHIFWCEGTGNFMIAFPSH